MRFFDSEFGVDRHCVSVEVIGLACNVNSKDHFTKGSANFMGRSSLK